MEAIRILFESRELAVCVKPRGVLSQSGKPGERSMVSLLEGQLGGNVYPVHRLDREVGGVMVYARTEKMAAELSRQIQQGKMEKEYLAAVQGVPAPEMGLMTDLLYHDKGKNKTYVVKRERKGVKTARLLYRVLGEREGCALTQVRLLTGRTHQIRVQFASRRRPLLGDGRYGGGSGVVQLWSMRLSFLLPKQGRKSFVYLPDTLGPFDALEAPEPLDPENFKELQKSP